MAHRNPFHHDRRRRPAVRRSLAVWAVWQMLLAGLIAGLSPAAARAGQMVIDNFNHGVAAWSFTEGFGQVVDATVSADEGTSGTSGLHLDYTFGPGGTNYPTSTITGIGFIGYQNFNHALFTRTVGDGDATGLDLSYGKTLAFNLMGTGGASVFLFVWDGQGRASAWGTYGGNIDFVASYNDWHPCRADLGQPASGSQADLSDIRRMGFLIHGFGPMNGSVWIDDLRIIDEAGKVGVAPAAFSPNGDACYDNLNITLYPSAGSRFTVEVMDAGKAIAATPFRDRPATGRVMHLLWNGRDDDGRVLPDGAYTLRATFAGPQPVQGTAAFAIDTRNPRVRTDYQADPFFPIGVWLEGSPTNSGYTDTAAGAKVYFDRCFADLAAHGLNCATVPNCPPQYWTTLLRSGQDHGVKVVLEANPTLVALVMQQTPLSAAAARSAAQTVYNQVGAYPSLLRYQIRDEPVASEISNWLTMQRAMWEVDKKHPVFSCFYGSEVLDQIAQQTAISEAVFDIYPLWQGLAGPTLGGFGPWFETDARAAHGYPMWIVVQDFANAAWRAPQAVELRAMTWQALAGGVKGVFFFLYRATDGDNPLGGMVDLNFNPTPLYAPTVELAGKLGRLAPLLLGLAPAAPPRAVRGPARAGAFTTTNGRPVLIVASTDLAAPATTTLTGVPSVKWRDTLTSDSFVSPAGELAVTLPPGEGRVLVGEKAAAEGWWLAE